MAEHFAKNGYHSDDEDVIERKALQIKESKFMLENKESKFMLDEVKQFVCQEYNDENLIKRKPLASKLNTIFSKKNQKLAKAQKFNVSY